MSENRRALFVDTSAYYALVDDADVNHMAATNVWFMARQQQRPIFTSNFIVAELHALMLGRHGQKSALKAIDAIYMSRDTIIRIAIDDEDSARSLLRQFSDKRYSFVDATSFVVTEKAGVPTAFTFDRHFVQHGLNVVGLEP